MLHKKPFFNISKRNLIAIIGIQNSNKKHVEYTINEKNLKKSFELGLTCNYNMLLSGKASFSTLGINQKEVFDFCSTCPCQCISKKLVYANEKSKYHLYHSTLKRLPKLSVKLYLLLHALHVNERGLIKNIDEESIAAELNCTVSSVRSSLSTLSQNGYIMVSNAVGSHYYNVMIMNYSDMYLTAKEGGNGYFQCSESLLDKLLTYDNVNALRFTIRGLLNVGMSGDIIPSKEKCVTYSFNDIKNILPGHINYIKAIKATMQDIRKDLLKTFIYNKQVLVEIDRKSDVNLEKTDYTAICSKKITDLSNTTYFSFIKQKDLTKSYHIHRDLVRLCLTFGHEIVEALSLIHI